MSRRKKQNRHDPLPPLGAVLRILANCSLRVDRTSWPVERPGDSHTLGRDQLVVVTENGEARFHGISVVRVHDKARVPFYLGYADWTKKTELVHAAKTVGKDRSQSAV